MSLENLKLEVTSGQAMELLKAIALRLEQSKNGNVEWELNPVAKQIEAYIRGNGSKVSLAQIRYPVKRVTVTFYDENPKKRPAELDNL